LNAKKLKEIWEKLKCKI